MSSLEPQQGVPDRGREITQIDFHQAMADFHTMFPTMDGDVIEAVLRANDGAVDATIDQLLTMAMDNEVELCRKSLDNPSSSKVHSPVSASAASLNQATGTQNQAQALDLLSFDCSPPPSYAQTMQDTAIATNASVAPPRSLELNRDLQNFGGSSREAAHLQRWRPPLLGPLPPDFLRLDAGIKNRDVILTTQILRERFADNTAQREALQSARRDDPSQLAMLEDERIALWFQNEEFLSQLKRDKDFIQSLESEESLNSTPSISAAPQQLPTHLQYVAHDDDAVFKEKLRHMGKVSKRKVATLARMFFKKKNGQQPILDEEEDDQSEGSLRSHSPTRRLR